MINEYQANIRKVREKRHYKITGSYGVSDSYKFYKKNGGHLSRSDYGKVINSINLLLKETFLGGKDITFPMKMGHLELRKFLTSVTFKDGRMKTNLPINWKETLNLWEEDEEAEMNKTLVRIETPQVFRIFYHKGYATYKNKMFYNFSVNRKFRLDLKDKIKEGHIDAFTF